MTSSLLVSSKNNTWKMQVVNLAVCASEALGQQHM